MKMSLHNNIMKIMIIAGGLSLASVSSAESLFEKQSIRIRITDSNGVNIENVCIKNSAGMVIGVTDSNGESVLNVGNKETLLADKWGYETQYINSSELIASPEVIMSERLAYGKSNDIIKTTFGDVSKRHTSGDYFVISGEELEKYPTLDLRNAMVGLIPGLDVTEINGSTGTSAEEMTGKNGATTKVVLRGRGSFAPLWVIDDQQIDISEMQIDPSEIESITFIKDATGTVIFGPAAANGVIYVKTKEGNANERSIGVNVESGIAVVDRFPEFVDGAEYARLNNMARVNSGLDPLYTESDIEKFALNDPYNMTHPSVNFRDIMLKDTKPVTRMNVYSKGGNNTVQYFANLGYVHEGDIYAIGSESSYDRINARANMNIRVNEFIKFSGNLFANIGLRNSPNYGYNKLSNYEFKDVINDITNISPVAFPIYAYNDDNEDYNRYAVSSVFSSNPIGNIVDNGYYTETSRFGASTFKLDIDFSKFVKGLSSHTIAGFNIMNIVRLGKETQYASYVVTPNSNRTEVDIVLKQLSTDASDQKNLNDYYWQRYTGYQNFRYQNQFGDHDIDANLNYYMAKLTCDGAPNPFCQQGGSFTLSYVYDDRYSVNGVLAYDGSQRFMGDKKFTYSPVIGASWIILDKSLGDKSRSVDFLKLRGEFGNRAVQIGRSAAQYEYIDSWSPSNGNAFGPHNTNKWQGNSQESSPYKVSNNRFGNPNLDWERQKEYSFGIDGLMFNRTLNFSLTYYNINRYNSIVSASYYPIVAGLSASPKINYGSTRYNGLEVAMKYNNKIGDFSYSIGGNLTYQNSKILERLEPDYRYDYQSRIGNPSEGHYGLEYLGRFSSVEEINEIPQKFDKELMVGDFKYADLNKDGVVDDNDSKYLGNRLPKIYYGLNVNLSYKNVGLYILANGRAAYDIALTNKYYQNGWGDNTYSAYVRDNVGKDYPRLTYYKVNNNYKFSSYWLTDGSFFKIQNVQLYYNVPLKAISSIGIKGVKIYLSGANLLTLSKIKDLDPESMDAGVRDYPLFRTFTAGVKLSF